MKSETSLVATEVRLAEWARLVQECKNRPADMNINTWCSNHGLSRANYYYRLRKVREAFLQNTSEETAPFVEISVAPDTSPVKEVYTENVAATLVLNGTTLQISDHASAGFLKNLLGALRYVE